MRERRACWPDGTVGQVERTNNVPILPVRNRKYSDLSSQGGSTRILVRGSMLSKEHHIFVRRNPDVQKVLPGLISLCGAGNWKIRSCFLKAFPSAAWRRHGLFTRRSPPLYLRRFGEGGFRRFGEVREREASSKEANLSAFPRCCHPWPRIVRGAIQNDAAFDTSPHCREDQSSSIVGSMLFPCCGSETQRSRSRSRAPCLRQLFLSRLLGRAARRCSNRKRTKC